MKRTTILFFLFASLLPTVIYGQAVSARLEGRIQDPVKAVVGSAEIVATEQETGQVFKTTSNEAGLYVFPNLAPGNYKLTVSASGFAPRDVDGIVLQIGDAKHADVLLAISGANSVVDVEADATSVNTTTTEIGSVVSNQQAVELPLNGRDAMMLVYLQAGTNPIDAQSTVTANGGGGPGAQQQVGVVDGLPPGTSEIKVEGILASNPGYDYSPSHPSMPVPQEAVGEYRVSTAGYSSGEGHGSGAQVNVLVKSGTNNFHGSVFEFNRNTLYNANDFFDKRQGASRPVLLRNQFGGSLGGPIQKGKTFVFGTAEWQRQIAQSIENRIVYTQPVRQGLFRYNKLGTNSSSLVDGNGNITAPASTIGTINLTTVDPSRQGFDTTFLPQVLAALPAPNNYRIGDALNTAGYQYHSSNPDNYYQFLFKVDHDLTSRQRIAGTYSQYFETAPQAQIITGLASEGLEERRRGLAVRWTYILSPKLLNEFSIGGNRRFASRPELITEQQGPENNFQLAGLGTGSVYGGTTNGNIYPSVASQKNPGVNLGFADTVTKTLNLHTIEFGGELWHETLNRTVGNPWPVISTLNSGSPATIATTAAPNLSSQDRPLAQQLVNDLTGTIGQTSQTFYASPQGYAPFQQQTEELRKHEYGLFVQDIWKVKSNLTLNLGLRWDLYPPVTIANGYVYPVDGYNGALGVNGPSNSPTRYEYTANKGGGIYNTDKNNFGPAIGFAYDPFRKGTTSLRASYRIAYDRQQIVANDFSSPNFGASTSITLNPGVQFGKVGTVLPITPPQLFATSTANVRQGTTYVADPHLTTPYVQSWTAGIEQQLFRDWTVSATYVSNHVVGEWEGVDLNQLQLQTSGFLAAFQTAQQNYAAHGSPTVGQSLGGLQALFAEVPSSQYNLLTTGQAATLSNFLDSNAPSGGARGDYVARAGLAPSFFRFNPQNLDVYVVRNLGQSNWNGLQLEVQRKLNRGVYLQANYTLSKGFANYAQDPQSFTTPLRDNANPNINKSLSPLDATHVVIANGLYELPFGRGQEFGSSVNRFWNTLIGGWRVSGIFGFTTGRPLAITTGYNLLNQNVASTPNFSGNYGHVAGLNKSGSQVRFLSASNAAQFTNPVAGSAGALPLVSVRGPAYTNLDTGLAKRTGVPGLREHAQLELRLELFNVLNHANFAAPSGAALNSNSATFGVIAGTLSPRIGQIAAKITF
jgi:hypothetical protein